MRDGSWSGDEASDRMKVCMPTPDAPAPELPPPATPATHVKPAARVARDVPAPPPAGVEKIGVLLVSVHDGEHSMSPSNIRRLLYDGRSCGALDNRTDIIIMPTHDPLAHPKFVKIAETVLELGFENLAAYSGLDCSETAFDMVIQKLAPRRQFFLFAMSPPTAELAKGDDATEGLRRHIAMFTRRANRLWAVMGSRCEVTRVALDPVECSSAFYSVNAAGHLMVCCHRDETLSESVIEHGFMEGVLARAEMAASLRRGEPFPEVCLGCPCLESFRMRLFPAMRRAADQARG